jgi:hypothetical protein
MCQTIHPHVGIILDLLQRIQIEVTPMEHRPTDAPIEGPWPHVGIRSRFETEDRRRTQGSYGGSSGNPRSSGKSADTLMENSGARFSRKLSIPSRLSACAPI